MLQTGLRLPRIEWGREVLFTWEKISMKRIEPRALGSTYLGSPAADWRNLESSEWSGTSDHLPWSNQ